MTLSYREITSILLESGSYFEIHQPGPNGTTHVYKGSDASAFIQRNDGRRHEHIVYDESGRMVYRRDYSGKLLVGTCGQWTKDKRRREVGATALQQILQDAVRRNKKFWLG